MSCGDAPHLHMLNLIAGIIPASLEFYRRLGVTVPAPADPHVQGVEPDALLLPLPAAGHEYNQYGRRPALPEPHARVPAAAARASTRAGNPGSFGIKEPQSAAACGCLGSSAGPCAHDAVALDRLDPPEIVATIDRWRKLMTESVEKPFPAQTCMPSRAAAT